jgi:hypothetical protein
MDGVGRLRRWRKAVAGVLPILFALVASGCSSIDGYPNRLEYSDQYITEVGGLVSPDAILRYGSISDVSTATLQRNNIVTAVFFQSTRISISLSAILPPSKI